MGEIIVLLAVVAVSAIIIWYSYPPKKEKKMPGLEIETITERDVLPDWDDIYEDLHKDRYRNGVVISFFDFLKLMEALENLGYEVQRKS